MNELIRFRLRELIKERGYKSENVFADVIGARRNTVNDVCNNEIKRLPVDLLDAICTELNITPGELIVHENAKKDRPEQSPR